MEWPLHHGGDRLILDRVMGGVVDTVQYGTVLSIQAGLASADSRAWVRGCTVFCGGPFCAAFSRLRPEVWWSLQ